MVKYEFSMKLQGATDEYKYVLSLNQNEEDNPEIIFTPRRREEMKESLQRQSSCKVDDSSLNRIIRAWKQDIEMGCRSSSISLDLALLADSQIDDLKEEGNQEIPALFKPDLSGIEPQFGALPPLIFQ